MIVDLILDRKDNLVYDALEFYKNCLGYVDEHDDIIQGLRSGGEGDVKAALCKYIKNNEYNPLLIDYIEQVNWVGVTAPEVEKAAAEAFNQANDARWAAANLGNKAAYYDTKERGVSYETPVPIEVPKQESSLDEKISAAKSAAIDISHLPLKIIEPNR